MQNRGVLLLALLIAAVLAAGSGYALYNAGDDSSPAVGVLPTTSATPSATPSETPSATPSETASPSASASASATATTHVTSSPSATHTTAKPTTSSTSYSYPKPSRQYDGLQLTISSPSNNEPAGSDFTLIAEASDGDGAIFFNGLSWGDGSTEPAAANPQHCKSFPPPTSQPGPYQPQPSSRKFTLHHRYLVGNRDYVITVKVASVNADCRPHGPKREDAKLYLRIHVKAPEPTPSP